MFDEESEAVGLLRRPLEEAPRMIARDEIDDAATIPALLAAGRFLPSRLGARQEPL